MPISAILLALPIFRPALPARQTPAGYHLVWADEFNKSGLPDPKDWTFENGFERNQELQWYRPENAKVEKGCLVIEGRRERVPNPRYDAASKDWKRNREFAEYTSACVKTMGRHSWQYGRFEIRARISAKPGLWPAIWTIGDSKPWPGCGEVDILEYYADSILANTVYGVGSGTWNSAKIPYAQIAKSKNWDTQFHVWRMDWDEKWIRLYLDGQMLNETDLSKTVNPDGFNPFHQPHYILLNLAIGSNGGDPSNTKFPTRYEVDYVRVFQKNDAR